MTEEQIKKLHDIRWRLRSVVRELSYSLPVEAPKVIIQRVAQAAHVLEKFLKRAK